MPGIRCAIAGCKNAYKCTRENSGSDIKYFSFPKDLQLCAVWVEKCSRNGAVKTATTRICSIHFEKNAFERDLMAELMHVPDRMKLKKTAVPTLELPSETTADEPPITVKITQNPYVKLDNIYVEEMPKPLDYKEELKNKKREYNKKVRKSQIKVKPNFNLFRSNIVKKPKNILKQSTKEIRNSKSEILKNDLLAKNVTFNLKKNTVHQLEHSDEGILQSLLTKRKKKSSKNIQDLNIEDSEVNNRPIKRRKLRDKSEVSEENNYLENITTEVHTDESITIAKMEYENIEYLDTEFNDENYFDQYQSKHETVQMQEIQNTSEESSIGQLENFVGIKCQDWEEEIQVNEVMVADQIENDQNEENVKDIELFHNEEMEENCPYEEIIEENIQMQEIVENIQIEEITEENIQIEEIAEENIQIEENMQIEEIIEENIQIEEITEINPGNQVNEKNMEHIIEDSLNNIMPEDHTLEQVEEHSQIEENDTNLGNQHFKENSQSEDTLKNCLSTINNNASLEEIKPNLNNVKLKASSELINKTVSQNVPNMVNLAPKISEENLGQIVQNPNTPPYVLYYVLPTNNLQHTALARSVNVEKIVPVVPNIKKHVKPSINITNSIKTVNEVEKPVENVIDKLKKLKRPERKLGEKQLQCLDNFRRLNYNDKIKRLKTSKIFLDEIPEKPKILPKIHLTPIANLTAKKPDDAKVNYPEFVDQNKQIMELMEKNRILRQQNETYKEQITTVTANYKTLRAEHRKTKQTVNYLQKLRPSNLAVNRAVVETLKNIFTENQIKLLTNKKKKVVWTKDEEVQALTIKNLSKRTYLYLKNQLGYPLPGLSTVQRWELRREREHRNSATTITESFTTEIVNMESDPDDCEANRL